MYKADELNPVSSDYNSSDVNGESQEDDKPLVPPTHGLTVITCALFIVGEMAGSGVLAIPKAISDAGWTGIGLLLVCCILSLYCGVILGKCWTILRKKKTVYQAYPRDPYPSIGYESCGRLGRGVVEVCLIVTLLGVCIVFLILASDNIASLVNVKIGNFTSTTDKARIWLLIISMCLLPFTYLESPKDIWVFALLATLATSVACVLIVIKSGIDCPSDLSRVPKSTVTIESFFSAFGTIAFSFGGATLFPSYQSDMKEPKKFPKAAMLGFLVVFMMYLPTGAVPFLAYGDNLDSNVLTTLKSQGDTGALRHIGTAAEVLITCHLLFSFVIALNPISLQVEEYLKWPQKFGWRRCLIRTGLMLVILGIAEAVPKFGPILSLIGGSTVTLMAFVLPCIFYLRLKPDAPIYVKVLHFEIVAVALVSGGTATYSAIVAIKNTF